MTPSSPELTLLGSLLSFLRDGGIIGCLLLFILGLLKQWWVLGWQYSEMKDLAFRGTEVAERVVDKL